MKERSSWGKGQQVPLLFIRQEPLPKEDPAELDPS